MHAQAPSSFHFSTKGPQEERELRGALPVLLQLVVDHPAGRNREECISAGHRPPLPPQQPPSG